MSRKRMRIWKTKVGIKIFCFKIPQRLIFDKRPPRKPMKLLRRACLFMSLPISDCLCSSNRLPRQNFPNFEITIETGRTQRIKSSTWIFVLHDNLYNRIAQCLHGGTSRTCFLTSWHLSQQICRFLLITTAVRASDADDHCEGPSIWFLVGVTSRRRRFGTESGRFRFRHPWQEITDDAKHLFIWWGLVFMTLNLDANIRINELLNAWAHISEGPSCTWMQHICPKRTRYDFGAKTCFWSDPIRSAFDSVSFRIGSSFRKHFHCFVSFILINRSN